MSRSKFVVTASLVVLAAAAASQAAIPLTNGSPSYSQNFNTLPASGSVTFTNDSTIAGWHSARTGTGTTVVADGGTNNAGNLYSYGSGTAAERAIGSVGSSNAAAGSFAWGAQFQNNGASNINSVRIDYVGEEWRNSAATAQTVAFHYRVGGSGFTTVNTGWTPNTSLDFVSPVTGGAASALNGNLAANRTSMSNFFAVTVAPTDTLWIKWSDPDHGGNDHGLSIDDFVITATYDAVPEPTTLAAAAAMGLVALRRRR